MSKSAVPKLEPLVAAPVLAVPTESVPGPALAISFAACIAVPIVEKNSWGHPPSHVWRMLACVPTAVGAMAADEGNTLSSACVIVPIVEVHSSPLVSFKQGILMLRRITAAILQPVELPLLERSAASRIRAPSVTHCKNHSATSAPYGGKIGKPLGPSSGMQDRHGQQRAHRIVACIADLGG